MSNFSAISWQEQVTCDDMIIYTLCTKRTR